MTGSIYILCFLYRERINMRWGLSILEGRLSISMLGA